MKVKFRCRICGKKKKPQKFDHGRSNCKAIEEACKKCVRRIRDANKTAARAHRMVDGKSKKERS